MFGHFSGNALLVVDIFRWGAIIWTIIAIGWLSQLIVLIRGITVILLVGGFTLSLFIDLSDQYIRVGLPEVSYRLPISYVELVMITFGIYHFMKSHPELNWQPPFYFFLRYRKRRGGKDTR